MKRYGRLAVWAIAVLLAIVGISHRAGAQNAQNFDIRSFTADYYLGRNQAQTSTLHTVETITAEFPDFDQNHGILRAIPQSYQGHTVSLKIDSITDQNGIQLAYTNSGQNGNFVLKIGDPGAYVHGLKTYKITYDVRNVTAGFADHDEFYWNVNGDQWQQPFADVLARIHIPAELAGSLQPGEVCYVGTYGQNDSTRCQISQPADEPGGKLITTEAKNLSAGETLTFAIKFNPGTFKLGPEIAQERRAKIIKYSLIAGATVAPALLSGIYLYSRWLKYGRDPKGRGVIIPEYEPPKGLNALSSDYIYLERLDNKAISALVIELAVRKYITIYEVDVKKRLQKDVSSFKLKLMKPTDDLSQEEKAVINMFFGTPAEPGAEADLSGLKNKLADDVKQLKKTLGVSLAALGYFRNDPNAVSVRYYGIGAFFGIGGLFLLTTGIFPLIALSIALGGLVFLVFSRYMPSRSEKGAAVHDQMLGLRDYIKLAEADRLKFLQSPEGAEKVEEAGLKPDDPQFRVKLFESLLPYAMLFGLEKGWAKQFEDVYTAAPDWYAGNWGTFNTVYLVSSLNSFSSVSSFAFSPPHSSGASGFGGGFAGGGGGGGGGGGW